MRTCDAATKPNKTSPTKTDPWAQPQRGRIIHPDDHTGQWTAGQLAEYVGFDWQRFVTVHVSGTLPPPSLPHGIVIDADEIVTTSGQMSRRRDNPDDEADDDGLF